MSHCPHNTKLTERDLLKIERRLNCLGMPEEFAGEPLHLFMHHEAVLWVRYDIKTQKARWQLVPVKRNFWDEYFPKKGKK